MYKSFLSTVPMLRLLLPLIAGIISHKFGGPSIFLFEILGLLFAVIGSLNKNHHEFIKKTILGVTINLGFFFFGFLISYFSNQSNYKYHYSHTKDVKYFLIQISDIGFKNNNYLKYNANVIGYRNNEKNDGFCKGKILIYIKDTSCYKLLSYGQLIWIPSLSLNKPNLPLNPGEFNFKNYLESHQIFDIAYLNKSTICITPFKKVSIIQQWVFQLQTSFKLTLNKFIVDGNAAAIAEALIDGNDDDIDKETLKTYAQTGTLHVLAVSGMHVGLLFWILGYIFKTFNQNKVLITVKSISILLVLWSYAMLCGLSPSILRATVMFSFITVGIAIKRNSSIYNTLSTSAIILILFNPHLITDAGFQLSYGAVIGIVLYQPYFINWFLFKWKYLNKIWELSAVSLAAQIVTLPIGLYYFSQFPTCFLFSNLIIIPFTTIILYCSIILLVVSPFSILSIPLGKLINLMIQVCNKTTFYIKEIPYAYIDNILVNKKEVFLMYLLLISITSYILYHRIHFLKLYLILVIIFFSVFGTTFLENHFQKNITFYTLNNGSCLRYTIGNNSTLIMDTLNCQYGYIIKKTQPDFLLKGIKHQKEFFLTSKWSHIQFNNFTVLISGIGKIPTITKHPNLLILRGYIEPQSIKSMLFNKIIISCFLTNNQMISWKKFCWRKNIELISLKETGAFQLNLDSNE